MSAELVVKMSASLLCVLVSSRAGPVTQMLRQTDVASLHTASPRFFSRQSELLAACETLASTHPWSCLDSTTPRTAYGRVVAIFSAGSKLYLGIRERRERCQVVAKRAAEKPPEGCPRRRPTSDAWWSRATPRERVGSPSRARGRCPILRPASRSGRRDPCQQHPRRRPTNKQARRRRRPTASATPRAPPRPRPSRACIRRVGSRKSARTKLNGKPHP